MSSVEASCSDCLLEIIEKKWTMLLLNWINKCVNPSIKVRHLDLRSLVEVTNKYKEDISNDLIDMAILTNEDVESFLKYKYPILRLRHLAETKDFTKKLYVMTSMMLYYCCTNSSAGAVDSDIRRKLNNLQQELILRFCENLSEMEPTINNVDNAIKKAYDATASSAKTNKYLAYTEEKIESENLVGEPRLETLHPPNSQFKSSLTVLPYEVGDSSLSNDSSDLDYNADQNNLTGFLEESTVVAQSGVEKKAVNNLDCLSCKSNCTCPKCSVSDPCSSFDTIMSKSMMFDLVQYPEKTKRDGNHNKRPLYFNWKVYVCLVATVSVLVTVIVLFSTWPSNRQSTTIFTRRSNDEFNVYTTGSAWSCEKGYCQKVYNPNSSVFYPSISQCILVCTGPLIWPQPIGYTYFSKKIINVATNRLDYKIKPISSNVAKYVGGALKLFIEDLIKLEKINEGHKSQDVSYKKTNILIDVESDPDPKLRYTTDESYTVKIETKFDQVQIKIISDSFCGVRHGLETLAQLIVVDQSTGALITLSNILVKDAPSYRYRGLMIDTARNYIPVPDIMRTLDAMGNNKLNTFHWRISDVTSFPWFIPEAPQLFQYGAYDKSMVYTKSDIKGVVNRARVRGIRVVIEVAAPGPVGRAWSWSPHTICPKQEEPFNFRNCDNTLCLRLKMNESTFDILQLIYSQILELTQVTDVFHLSNGIFSIANCFHLLEDRDGFLEKALERLRIANKGVLPKLPIVWYSRQLLGDLEALTWDGFGVQMNEWVQGGGAQFLSRFRVIHSSRWDLSCEIRKQRCTKYRTWQEMYAWKSWRSMEVFSIEGGESVLWTDLVDGGNLDYHLWPRAAAVAERLWSDITAGPTATGSTYVRLDAQRWRMLVRGIKVQPIWPVYCSFNPKSCIPKLKMKAYGHQ